MSKRIIVAGAGHGGLAAAARLARAGLEVTVLERNERGKMGYDWTDIFAPGALSVAGIPMPPEDKYEYKYNMTFYNPSLSTALMQHVAPDQLEIKMERSEIYDLLIENALQAGAEIVFGCTVTGPITAGCRVIGVHTEKCDYYADLVIDACGLNSPVRCSLPEMCGIESDVSDFEQFYVYRAFYDKLCEGDEINRYKVYLLPQGKLGVGWVACEGEYTDVLIGRFKPFDMEQVEQTLEFFREHNPHLGTRVLRGGQFVNIPVRQPLSVLVCDGYAAIGDSAFMTVPIIGSGIANTLKASKILCDVVLADAAGAYSARSLWQYQLRFFRKIGSGLAPLAQVKSLLTQLTPEELDYMFENGILTADDLTIGADSTSLTSMLKLNPAELLAKVKAVSGNKQLVGKIASLVAKVGASAAVTAAVPAVYSPTAVKRWATAYKKVHRR